MHVKICDFDLTAEVRGGVANLVAVGTSNYSAPERFGGEALSPAADIWAWGLICYTVSYGLTVIEP
jgi:serine/threonine protein kinase